MRLSRIARLDHGPRTGTWYRAVGLIHWKTPTSTDHSRTTSSRFSVASTIKPAYRTLYLGETHQVVLYEVEALLGPSTSPIPNPKGSWLLTSLEVTLGSVVDLTSNAQQRIVGTNDQELTGVWKSSNTPAPTQLLGAGI